MVENIFEGPAKRINTGETVLEIKKRYMSSEEIEKLEKAIAANQKRVEELWEKTTP